MRFPCLFLLLASTLGAQSATEYPPLVKKALELVNLEDLPRQHDHLEKIAQHGGQAILDLRQKLELSAVQPRLKFTNPPDRVTEPRGTSDERVIDLVLEFTNPSDLQVLIRPRAIKPAVKMRYQSFGFTWDGGAASTRSPQVSLSRVQQFMLLERDETAQVTFSFGVEMSHVGRYTFDVSLDRDGPLSIPEDESPKWLDRTSFHIDYLPAPGRGGYRLVSRGTTGGSKVRLRADTPTPVHSAGKPIPINIQLQNLDTARPVVLPDSRSFFGSPLWYVLLDPRNDRILDFGNLIPLEEMLPEKTSTQVATFRLRPSDSTKLLGSINTRLRPSRDGTNYACVIGYTCHRDTGSQGLLIGDIVAPDLSITLR